MRKDSADDDSDSGNFKDNHHGLVANAMVTTADGFAEPEAAKTTPGKQQAIHRQKPRWVLTRAIRQGVHRYLH